MNVLMSACITDTPKLIVPTNYEGVCLVMYSPKGLVSSLKEYSFNEQGILVIDADQNFLDFSNLNMRYLQEPIYYQLPYFSGDTLSNFSDFNDSLNYVLPIGSGNNNGNYFDYFFVGKVSHFNKTVCETLILEKIKTWQK